MPPPRERDSISVRAERAVLAAVRLPNDGYDESDPFGELGELCRQAGGRPVATLEQRRETPEAGTYMGRGKLEELKLLCDQHQASMIVFDHGLSPKQIASIEQATERKVIDRSELILDIFASRATTHEAKLQVELAQLEYTYPRLRAMWSHLERIVGRGGIGGVGTRGPGEQQLEIDRRLVQRRKSALQAELATIQDRKRRAVQKRNLDHFTVGLVGYTNAGKSTLFNTMTAGGAYADDRLFATLMTRTRAWDLGGGAEVMLSDTVGFVRDLPTNLVASFRATLEEATHADLLLIVLDVADPASELRFSTVLRTLDDLFEEVEAREERARRSGEVSGPEWYRPRLVVCLNKADLLTDHQELLVWRSKLERLSQERGEAIPGVPLCALPPNAGVPRTGHEELAQRVRRAVEGEVRRFVLTLPLSESRAINTIETRGEVHDRAYEGSTVTLTADIGDRRVRILRAQTPGLLIDGETPSDKAASAPGW